MDTKYIKSNLQFLCENVRRATIQNDRAGEMDKIILFAVTFAPAVSEKIAILVTSADDLVDYETRFADRGIENDSWPAHRLHLVSAIILIGRAPNTAIKINFFSGPIFLS